MTKDDIIRMAREAGFEKVVVIDPDGSKTVTVAPIPELLAFAKLVAAAEREACAKVCEQPIDEIQITDDCSEVRYMDGKECAAAIRARGNT